MTKLFKGMPPIMIGIFVIFALVPVWSFVFVSNPIVMAMRYPVTGTAHLLAFIVLPLVLCATILLKHPLVFIAFLLECVALLVLTFVSGTSQAVAWIQSALVILFAVTAAVIADSDLLFPFLNSNARFWRRHARIPTTIQAQIQTGGTTIHAIISDISTLGFGVMVDKSRYPDFNMDSDATPTVVIPSAPAIEAIPTAVAWIRNPEGVTQIGLRATTKFDANKIFELTGQRGLQVHIPFLAPLVNTPGKRKIVTVTCLLVLIAVFAARFLMYRPIDASAKPMLIESAP